MVVGTKRTRHPKPSLEARAGRAIRHAAGIIRDKGWVKGSMGSSETGFCVMGAIEWGIKDSRLQQSTKLIFAEWLCQQLPEIPDSFVVFDGHTLLSDGFSIISMFNDRISSDKEYILATMSRFADEMDPQSAS